MAQVRGGAGYAEREERGSVSGPLPSCLGFFNWGVKGIGGEPTAVLPPSPNLQLGVSFSKSF